MKSSIYFFLSIPITFLFIEILIRFLIWCISINFFIWTYGIDSSVNFEIENLKELDFLITHEHVLVDGDEYQQIKETNLPEIWTFGGSTTAGFNCGDNSSSWPNELNRLNLDYNVKNFAKNGSNSDFAYHKLLENINKGYIPDLVIWAGRVNELDVLTRGFKRNKEKLNLPNDPLKGGLNNLTYNLKTIDKTIKNYSVFYVLLDGIIFRLRNKIIQLDTILDDFTTDELKLAALNYKLNTKDAIELAEIYDFKFTILTIIKKEELDNITNSNWDNILDNEIIQLSKSANTNWIDTRQYLYNYKISDDLFCDEVHQTLIGNKQIAKYIYDSIDKIIKK